MLLLVTFSAIGPTIEGLCTDAMVNSLSLNGFSLFAHALCAHNFTTTTSYSTPLMYLAPPDTTLVNHPLDSDTLLGHVSTAGALPYQYLLTLPANTTLPTLHHNTTLIVGNDGKRVSFNNVAVVVPNLYIDGSCSIHGVDRPLVPDDVSPSPAYPPRRRFHQISDYILFIRRAHHPNLVDGNGTKEPDLHWDLKRSWLSFLFFADGFFMNMMSCFLLGWRFLVVTCMQSDFRFC